MPVTRSAKGNVKAVVDLKARPKKSKEKTVPHLPSTPPSTAPSFPVEIITNILRYTETSTLGQCMRVSKTFYQVAGPLLYSNIVINTEHPLSPVLVGKSVVNRDTTAEQGAAVNLKNSLLSLIRHVTIVEHICSSKAFTGPLLRIPTLLVVPPASCRECHHVCLGRIFCPTIASIRPQKVVLHHTRLGDYDDYDTREHTAKQFPFTVWCPTLTLVLDETGCHHADLDHEMSYQHVNVNLLKDLRIIVHKTPGWLDEIAQRSTCHTDKEFTVTGLASRILGPVIAPIIASGSIEVTIYLFCQLYGDSPDSVAAAIEAGLSERRGAAGLDLAQRGRPRYTIRTLSDYISEGLEDELLPEELEYWREQNQKRLAMSAAEQEGAHAV